MSLCQVSSLYRLSISQVSSIWSRVRVESQVFIAGVKSQVFGHDSESSLKSFNSPPKKSHSESSCIEIVLFMNLFYAIDNIYGL